VGEAQGFGGLGCQHRGFFVGRYDRAEGEATDAKSLLAISNTSFALSLLFHGH